MTKLWALAAFLVVAACGDNFQTNLPPEVSTARVTVTAAEDGTVSVVTSAADPEGAALTYTASQPAHGTISGTGPNFVYTPNPDYTGTDSFTITVSDGTSSVVIPVTVMVSAVNDAPSAADQQVSTNEDQGVAVTLVATDVDSATLTYEIIDGPTHGTLSGVAPSLTYTPARHYHGADSFTFRASDGSLASNVATVTIETAHVQTCGDGVQEGAEQCDDGNTSDADACLNNCMAASCGDGHVYDGYEACDDGNGDNTDACLTTCVAASCGDGFVEAEAEACDDGNTSNNDGCLSTCSAASCGDGFVETGVEACDDGNASDTDACLSTCRAASCGDGHVESGVEQCDDGNTDDSDACHNNCTLTAPPVCGDNHVDFGEECDDGNTADGDGCGHSCLTERCGDGLTQLGNGESCDDGNTTAGDGCDATCNVEPFTTTPPVNVSVATSCTTAVANAARKIAIDGSGNIYAVMKCGSDAAVVASTDRGLTFSAPFTLSAELPNAPVTVAQVAVASGPSGVAYVAMELSTGEVYLRTTEDRGATWSAASLIGTATSTSAGLSLSAFNDDVYIGFSMSGGVNVARNHARGAGAFELTPVSMSIAFFDLLYDIVRGTLAVCADTPSFHIRASSDAGATFGAEVNPPGSEYYSDWAIGNGKIFSVGTNLGASGNATSIYIIPTDDLATSTSVTGLPSVSTAQTRSIAADAAGNAFVASQLNGGGVQLDRLGFGATAFDTSRAISATGGSPVVAPLPGGSGAAVIYTDGTSVYVTIQAY